MTAVAWTRPRPGDETLDVTSTESLSAPYLDEAVTATASTDSANRAFSTSIAISAIRCTLTYVVFPWILPALGLAGGVGPGVGLVIGLVAIGFNVASIRRFWVSDHQWKVPVSVLNGAVIALLTVLVVLDLRDLLG